VEDLGEVKARVKAAREAMRKGKGVLRASWLVVTAVLGARVGGGGVAAGGGHVDAQGLDGHLRPLVVRHQARGQPLLGKPPCTPMQGGPIPMGPGSCFAALEALKAHPCMALQLPLSLRPGVA